MANWIYVGVLITVILAVLVLVKVTERDEHFIVDKDYYLMKYDQLYPIVMSHGAEAKKDKVERKISWRSKSFNNDIVSVSLNLKNNIGYISFNDEISFTGRVMKKGNGKFLLAPMDLDGPPVYQFSPK